MNLRLFVIVSLASLLTIACNPQQPPSETSEGASGEESENPAPSQPAEPEEKPLLHGQATIQLKIKEKPDPLPGIELVLVPPSVAESIQKVRDEGWLRLAHPKRFADGLNNLDLMNIGRTAVKASVARTKADIVGNYEFHDVEPGNYLLYGQYKSRWAAGYWLLPVEIKADESVEVDLNETNMKEVYNYQLNIERPAPTSKEDNPRNAAPEPNQETKTPAQ